ncbi:MAG: bifunctional diaminohydroxyphosphoribosylaminopyrimidine deaminase/5-amino-6-(5-phosphoribosylamino)uracil reductase RibD [Bacteroides sp.]|nr:bifunctional diaminohydroxyphosphoribosylaminopyrimidine deaminase/5-amino-6-(5-phosphoribosylamino)uracil reductase RibD [Bacteroides sp.]
MKEDELYMHRCIQIARNGLCGAPPNPMVGAVIVCDGKIIGEGYHAKCGEAHAEVNAIRSVKNHELLKRSTIYVSLEPCAHHGKTPPCADLIVEKQLKRVVIGCQDPFAKVNGKGIEKLRQAGIEVEVGVLEDACLELISRFVTFHAQKRPYITLKWAQSSDGFIDYKRCDGEAVKLSNNFTRMLVHKRRSEHTAILVGRRTALLDNPSLTIRDWHGKAPIRLVLDKDLSLPRSLHLFDGSVPTIVFTSKQKAPDNNVEYIQLDFSTSILPQMMEVLCARNIQSLLVEGGSVLLQSFLDENLWDEIFVEEAPLTLQDGVKAPIPPKDRLLETNHYFGRIITTYKRK